MPISKILESNSNNSKKKKDPEQGQDRLMENEERQERQTASQTLIDRDIDKLVGPSLDPIHSNNDGALENRRLQRLEEANESKDYTNDLPVAEDLNRKYDVAKREDTSKFCYFCYVCKNTDVRRIADHMYRKKSLSLREFLYVVNDDISEIEQWQILGKMTPELSVARKGFINALLDEYSQVEQKIRIAFKLEKGTLLCICTDRGAKMVTIDKKPFFTVDGQDTIDKSSIVKNESFSGSVEACPIIKCSSEEKLNDDENDKIWIKTIDKTPTDGGALESRLQKLEEALSGSQERQTSQFIQQHDKTNGLIQNLYRLVEPLVKMAAVDLYESDYDECDDDLISEAPHKDVVRESLLDIKDNLDTKYILDELYAKKAIDHDERQSVQGQTTDARKTRRLAIILEQKPPATFEAFLRVLNGDKQLSWLYEKLQRKYDAAKRGAKSKCCLFCYVCDNTDLRKIADDMFRKKLSLNSMDYKYLVNDSISEAERWETLRKMTPKMSVARDGFINALQDLYPEVEKKIKFKIDKGTLLCTCSNRTSKNCEPRIIKKKRSAKLANDIISLLTEDDQYTIKKFLSEEIESISGSESGGYTDSTVKISPRD